MSDALVFLSPPLLVAVCLVGIHAYFASRCWRAKSSSSIWRWRRSRPLGATVAFMARPSGAKLRDLWLFARLHPARRVLLAFTRAWGTRVPQEALIGVIYVVAAGAGHPADRPRAAGRRAISSKS